MKILQICPSTCLELSELVQMAFSGTLRESDMEPVDWVL